MLTWAAVAIIELDAAKYNFEGQTAVCGRRLEDSGFSQGISPVCRPKISFQRSADPGSKEEEKFLDSAALSREGYV